MAAEIERKFHLAGLPEWLQDHTGDEIEQGYLAFNERGEVRLRRRGRERLLTVKRGSGEVREEIEVPLGVGGFERLWGLTASARVNKRRYVVVLDDGLAAEVDVYAGSLAGLAVVEVEFGSEEQSRAFRPPSWFGRELTGDERYSNLALALSGQVPDDVGAVRSRAYRLEKNEEPAEGVRRIALGRLSKASERLAEARRGEGVAEAIHGARKDLKKLRSLLRLIREQLGEKAYRRENARYREAARAISDTRDAQVKAETLDSLLEEGAGLDAATLQVAAGWKRELVRESEEAGERGRGGDAVAAAVARLEGAEDSIAAWTLGGGSWSLVRPGFARAYERGREAMADAAGGDPEAVHQWRKRAKDLRYHQDILRLAWPDGMKADAKRSHELTDLLGEHHDLTVLVEDMRGRALPGTEAAALEAAIAARQERLLGEALELGGHVYVEKPGAFAKRQRGHWKLRSR